VRLETKCGASITVASQQRLAVISREGYLVWRPACELQPGDYLLVDLGRTLQAWGQRSLVRLQAAPPASPHSPIRPHLPGRLEADLATFMGLYVANGCYHDGRIIIAVNAKDQDLAAWLKEFLARLGLHPHETIVGDCIVVTACCKQVVQWLVANDCHKQGPDPGSASAHVPEGILCSPLCVAAVFLSAYFATDGCASLSGSDSAEVSASTASPQLAAQLMVLLRHLGIRAALHSRPPKGPLARHTSYEVRVSDAHSAKLFGQRIRMMSQRKQDILCSASTRALSAKGHYIENAAALLDDLNHLSRGLELRVRRSIWRRRELDAFNVDWAKRMIQAHPQLQASKIAELLIEGADYVRIQSVTAVPDQEWVNLVTATGEPVYANAFPVATGQMT
jgi:hypothetical protein